MENNKVLRMAIIGAGNMGGKYAKMIESGSINRTKLTAICARSEASKKWVQENLSSDVKYFSNTEDLFENSDCFDAVLITTPHKTHPELTMKAFELGKHVFCEKPAGVSLSDAKKMDLAAQKADKKYAMMFHCRTYPLMVQLKKLLTEGTVGTINRIILENSIYYRTNFYHQSGTWRSSWTGEGGGLLINQAQHLIDYWQWLFGMPESIYANIPFGKYNDFKVDDEATLLMEYPNKVTGVFIITTGEIQREERLCIIGSKGKISVNGNEITIERNEMDALEYGRTAQINTRDQLKTTTEKIICPLPDKNYEIMLNNFTDAVLDGASLIASGNEGTKALEISNAAYLSAWQHKKIQLPINSNEFDKLLKSNIEQENPS